MSTFRAREAAQTHTRREVVILDQIPTPSIHLKVARRCKGGHVFVETVYGLCFVETYERRRTFELGISHETFECDEPQIISAAFCGSSVSLCSTILGRRSRRDEVWQRGTRAACPHAPSHSMGC